MNNSKFTASCHKSGDRTYVLHFIGTSFVFFSTSLHFLKIYRISINYIAVKKYARYSNYSLSVMDLIWDNEDEREATNTALPRITKCNLIKYY